MYIIRTYPSGGTTSGLLVTESDSETIKGELKFVCLLQSYNSSIEFRIRIQSVDRNREQRFIFARHRSREPIFLILDSCASTRKEMIKVTHTRCSMEWHWHPRHGMRCLMNWHWHPRHDMRCLMKWHSHPGHEMCSVAIVTSRHFGRLDMG